MADGQVTALYRRIYRVIRRIPRGKVATYGQVAELAGIPGGARVAAAALRVSTPAMGLPWQRVVGKRSPRSARISILDPVGAAIQRGLLEQEGVRLSEAGAISLADFGWLPTQRSGKKRAARPKARRSRH
jgi:methylated-DNA-protein-cysteine methyltransferase related protein